MGRDVWPLTSGAERFMKTLTIIGEFLGLISSLLLAWGYKPPKGTMTWAIGDGSQKSRSEAILKKIAISGFLLLALSFAVKIYIILSS